MPWIALPSPDKDEASCPAGRKQLLRSKHLAIGDQRRDHCYKINEIDQWSMTIPTSLGIHVFNFYCERLKIAAMARKRSNTGASMVLAKELPSTTMIPCEEGRLGLHNCGCYMRHSSRSYHVICHVSHVLSRYLQLYSVMLLLDSKV